MASSRNRADERVDVVAVERVDVGGRAVDDQPPRAGSVPAAASTAASAARARRSALLTASALVSSSTATSVGTPAQHVAQDQHRPLAGREVLQGGDEREPHGLA